MAGKDNPVQEWILGEIRLPIDEHGTIYLSIVRNRKN